MHLRHILRVAIYFGVLWVTTPAAAHHGRAVQFDPTRPIALAGTVTAIEWQRPHAGFNLDVKDASGKVTNWEFVFGGPNNPLRRGWTRTSLTLGDVVWVRGFPARDGSPVASAVEVTVSAARRRTPASAP
jgi:hypothetical protein